LHGSVDDSNSQLDSYDENKAPATATSLKDAAKFVHPFRANFQIPTTFEGEPKWLVTKDNPVFSDDEEMWEAIGEAGITWIRDSPFPEHPVRYMPEDAAGTANAYRTVMMDHIPVGTTMKDVLALVRGGALESIQLIPPIGRVTSFMTARIVFNYELAANTMWKYQEKIPFKINGIPVRTWKPVDPTYPRNAELEEAIFGDEDATRIVLIGNIDDDVFAMIPTKLARLNVSRAVVDFCWLYRDEAAIEFADIKSAVRVMKAFREDHDLWGATFRYDEDYTTGKYPKRE
jgi:hypothetical protein